MDVSSSVELQLKKSEMREIMFFDQLLLCCAGRSECMGLHLSCVNSGLCCRYQGNRLILGNISPKGIKLLRVF